MLQFRDRLNLIAEPSLPGSGSSGDIIFFSGVYYGWNGSSWVSLSGAAGGGIAQKISMPFAITGKPSNGQKILPRLEVVYDMTLSEALSRASAGVAATATSTFVIKKNGTQIGTIVWSATATTGVVDLASASIGLSVGDILSVEAPATADATLADIAITFAGDGAQIGGGSSQKMSAVIGNGTSLTYTVTHNFGTRIVCVNVFDNVTYEDIIPDIARPTTNTITVTFRADTIPSTGQYTVVVMA